MRHVPYHLQINSSFNFTNLEEMQTSSPADVTFPTLYRDERCKLKINGYVLKEINELQTNA